MGFGPNELDQMIRQARDKNLTVAEMASLPVPKLETRTPLGPESPTLKPLPEDAGISTSVSMDGLEPEELEEEEDLRNEYIKASGRPTTHVPVPPAPQRRARQEVIVESSPSNFLDLDSGAAVMDGYPIALSKMELSVIKRVIGTSIVRQLRQEATMISRLHGRKRIQKAPQKKAARKRRTRRVPALSGPADFAGKA